jgi:nitrite reductase/ring-hydroxylating ferredoxin subunit/alkylhydroperoxidase/carboxymuconolactone decarboxylase family protein YurZ
MSDALDYLIKARPDALGHYFAFLKACGKHLDPKTRNLISVITKVDAQTERGFRQDLGRALREGCTPMEILDALLMAFPTLGLAKIIWAVDIILAMNLPDFRPQALSGQGEWHDLGATRGVKAGGVRRIECDGRALFVYRDGKDGWQVYDSRCPHQSTDIPHLALEGTRLTCPKHHWAFDVRTGNCVDKGSSPLRRWDSRVVDGRLQAYW